MNDFIGQTVKDIREMTKKELENEGWDDFRDPGICVVLGNGAKIYASRDYEGNGPGALFGTDSKGRSVYLDPVSKSKKE